MGMNSGFSSGFKHLDDSVLSESRKRKSSDSIGEPRNSIVDESNISERKIEYVKDPKFQKRTSLDQPYHKGKSGEDQYRDNGKFALARLDGSLIKAGKGPTANPWQAVGLKKDFSLDSSDLENSEL